MLDTMGGELIFTYNDDGLLQKVSGPGEPEDNFFYTRSGELFRLEKSIEGMPTTVWLFAYDEKGRVISKYKKDNAPGDSLVFKYDDQDRIIGVSNYSGKTEILFYYDIEFPDVSTVKRTVYLRDQFIPELSLSEIDTYELDNYQRPHPTEYYLSRDQMEEVFLPHNVLSKRTAAPDGVTVGTMTIHTYNYTKWGHPSMQDMRVVYGYNCEWPL
ncbi:MAG: hypothetical protein QM762_09960 [Chryseolinea sp.]